MENVPSTKPYLIRALYEWCLDNGFTPYLSVAVDGETAVPAAFVKDGQITLNISVDATQNLVLGNDEISFAARFSGVATNISVPVGRVLAVYARENGVGMGFPIIDAAADDAETDSETAGAAECDADGRPAQGEAPTQPEGHAAKSDRPALKRIK